MPAPLPTWRRLFDRIENAIGRPLEEAVADPRFNEAMLLGLELSNGLARRWRKGASTLLHLRNLPSHSDVRKLERRLGLLEKQLLDLSAATERIEDAVLKLHAGGGIPECPPTPPRKTRSRRSAKKSIATPGARATD